MALSLSNVSERTGKRNAKPLSANKLALIYYGDAVSAPVLFTRIAIVGCFGELLVYVFNELNDLPNFFAINTGFFYFLNY